MKLVLHVYCYNPETAEEEILYLTSGTDYVSDGNTYVPCIGEGFVFDQSLFSKGAVGGGSSSGFGQFSLNNLDGKLDGYVDYFFDGRKIVGWEVESNLTDVALIKPSFTAVITKFEANWDTFEFELRDARELLNVPHQTNVFAGGFVHLPGVDEYNFEGEDDTIKGEVKPVVYGEALNIEMYPINRFLLIFGCNYDDNGNRAPIQQIWDVFDKGGRLLFEGFVNNISDLEATTVAAGYYKVALTEGAIRLGDVNQGAVTANVCEAVGEEASVGAIIKRILLRKGITAYIDEELTALTQLAPFPAQYYVTGDETTIDIISDLLASIHGWMVADEFGNYRFGILDSNDYRGSVAVGDEITPYRWIEGSIARDSPSDTEDGVPPDVVKYHYDKYWHVATKDSLLPTISEADKERFSKEYVTQTISTPQLREDHVLARSFDFESLLVGRQRAGNTNPDWQDGFTDWGISDGPPDNEITLLKGKVQIVGDGAIDCTLGKAFGTNLGFAFYAGEYEIYVEVDSSTGIGSVRVQIPEIGFDSPIVVGTNMLRFTMDTVNASYFTLNVLHQSGKPVATTVISRVAIYRARDCDELVTVATTTAELIQSRQERFTLGLNAEQFPDVVPGAKKRLSMPRFALEEGDDFLVTEVSRDRLDNRLDVALWRIRNAV